MEFVVVFLSTLAAGFLLVHQRKKNIRQAGVKKEAIIENYKSELKELMANASEEEKKDKKIAFLKNCNDELSRNIYFTQDEAKEVLDRLSKI